MVDIADRNLSVVNELFEAGEVARNDVLQAKIEQQKSELSREKFECGEGRSTCWRRRSQVTLAL